MVWECVRCGGVARTGSAWLGSAAARRVMVGGVSKTKHGVGTSRERNNPHGFTTLGFSTTLGFTSLRPRRNHIGINAEFAPSLFAPSPPLGGEKSNRLPAPLHSALLM